MKKLETTSITTFEQIKQIDDQGNEFWYARPLAKMLDYADLGIL